MSLTPAPIVWGAPGEAPPELVCLVSHFYPAEGLEVEWELRGGPGGSSRKAEGKTWLSTVRHHSDGSVSQSGHLQLPPVTAKQHGVRYACRVHHPSLPASGRSAEVTLEVAGNHRLGNLQTRVSLGDPRLICIASLCQASPGPPSRTASACSCPPSSSWGSSRH